MTERSKNLVIDMEPISTAGKIVYHMKPLTIKEKIPTIDFRYSTEEFGIDSVLGGAGGFVLNMIANLEGSEHHLLLGLAFTSAFYLRRVINNISIKPPVTLISPFLS